MQFLFLIPGALTDIAHLPIHHSITYSLPTHYKLFNLYMTMALCFLTNITIVVFGTKIEHVWGQL
jgi:hypothetical protein